jgi:small subunit ribosomal protein S14
MTAKNYKKMFKQLTAKPVKYKKFLKHNSPKPRKFGAGSRKCKRCGRYGAHIQKYDMHLCRQCFRDIATDIGFKKFS